VIFIRDIFYWIEDAFHLKRLAFPWWRMGENGRGMGKEKDPGMWSKTSERDLTKVQWPLRLYLTSGFVLFISLQIYVVINQWMFECYHEWTLDFTFWRYFLIIIWSKNWNSCLLINGLRNDVKLNTYYIVWLAYVGT
jgi:hypothetical protein